MFPTFLELDQIFEIKKINSAKNKKSIKKKEIFYGLFLCPKVNQVLKTEQIFFFTGNLVIWHAIYWNYPNHCPYCSVMYVIYCLVNMLFYFEYMALLHPGILSVDI